jgi:hypothetical protein
VKTQAPVIENSRKSTQSFSVRTTLLDPLESLVFSLALLANRPDAKLDVEPTVPLRDVEAMFLEKRLPDGWERWKKSRLDWLKNTTDLLISAGKKYWFLKRQL